MEPFDVSGTWWVPKQKRHRKATGFASYEASRGTRIRVFGRRLDEGASVYEPVLHGDTEEGPMTLFGCVFESATQDSRVEHASQEFTCETSIFGGHLSRETRFKYARFSVTYLDEWSRLGRIAMTAQGPAVMLHQEPGWSADLTDGSKLSLSVSAAATGGLTTGTVTAKRSFELYLAHSKTLDQIVDDYVTPLANLVTLLVDVPSSVVSLAVGNPTDPRVRLEGYKIGLTVKQTPPDGNLTALSTQIVRSNEIDLAAKVAFWIDQHARLRRVQGLHFGLRHSPDMSAEARC
jgi:ApeA N-terminal domain 1